MMNSRLDIRHILLILILLISLYWLLTPSAPNAKSNRNAHKENFQKYEQQINKQNKVESFEQGNNADSAKDATISQLRQQVELLESRDNADRKSLQEELENEKKESHNLKQRFQLVVNNLQNDVIRLNQSSNTGHSNMDELDEEIIKLSTKNDQLIKENVRLKSKAVSTNAVTLPFKGLKLVHLDLKGAPPKIDYLITFIKYSKTLGADGLLIEYEDMFPWNGALKVLRSSNAYTESDIELILNTAKQEGMTVIPLIQTFGHLEFLLKHKKFAHLRADKEISTSICPMNNQSVPLVQSMLDQVMKLHPRSKYIHLGGDEVWNLATCRECVRSKMTKSQLYLHHLTPLFKHVSKSVTKGGFGVKSIIWDDMLRTWDVTELNTISNYALPMVWAYVSDLSYYKKFPSGMWGRYTQVFKEIWLASSFKGALKPWSNMVPIKQHMQNHLSWLKITTMLEKKRVQVAGIAVTGWSRFDHYGPLCEILPVGVPSLALCLGILNAGGFSEDLHKNISKQLGFSEPFRIDLENLKWYTPESADYPGADVYHLAGSLENALGWRDWTYVRVNGWMRNYFIEKKHISFFQFNESLKAYSKSKDLLNTARTKVEFTLGKYFYEETIEEWIADKFEHNLKEINKKIVSIKSIMKKLFRESIYFNG